MLPLWVAPSWTGEFTSQYRAVTHFHVATHLLPHLCRSNAAFEKETGISQSQLSNMTVFNIIHANDLQKALDMISHLIDSGYATNGNNQAVASQHPQEPLLLQSSIANRPDLGLCVTLIRGRDAMPKWFSVTLVKNASTGGAKNGSLTPYNPALPSIPSTPMQFVSTSARPTPQEIPQQQPNALTMPVQNAATIDKAVTSGTASVQGPAADTFLQGAGSSQVSAMSGLSLEQTAGSQAPSNVPPPQLLQLLLFQQMQQGQGQVQYQQQQQQQGPVAQGPQQIQQFQLAMQQQQQQQQQPNHLPQLPTVGITQNAPVASGQAHSGQWNVDNLAMLPQIQQILKPNSSPQGSDGDRKEAVGQGTIQNQPMPQLPAYQNIPMLPQFQQILKPSESNAPSQGSKNSSGDERDDSRPWYYAG